MRKFQDIDLITTLRKIVNNNTMHYKTDFEYDVNELKNAVAGSQYLWMSRLSGTHIFNDEDVYIRNTYAHNTWVYYKDPSGYGVKSFAVEVTSNDNEMPIGNIYELNYEKHRAAVVRNSFDAVGVAVTFKPPHWDKEATSISRMFGVAEYNDNWGEILKRYGQAKDIFHILSDENNAQLNKVCNNAMIQYKSETSPADINEFVRDMVKTRFHAYGYTRDDMVFTTMEDAFAAVKHKIPAYVLRPNNTAELITDEKDVNDAIIAGHMLGMDAQNKQLLNFFLAGNTLANLPFARDELTTIFQMALEKGKDNNLNENDRERIDGLIRVLDTALFSIDTHDEITQAQEYTHDESEGVEP
ncbi:MAG: hypothetical protein FWC16_09685 [Defluviitaleaceae bacterium]|nr:hypothetical protein [Defluviitaleaceae bacterium]